MTAEVSRVAPLRAGWVFGLTWFGGGCVLTIPILAIGILGGAPESEGDKGAYWLIVAYPLLCLVMGTVVGALLACSYNVVAKLVGGLSLEIAER